jgi:hypothetical protein
LQGYCSWTYTAPRKASVTFLHRRLEDISDAVKAVVHVPEISQRLAKAAVHVSQPMHRLDKAQECIQKGGYDGSPPVCGVVQEDMGGGGLWWASRQVRQGGKLI